LFAFYSVSAKAKSGLPIFFRVRIDELEMKSGRSSTLSNDRPSTALG